SRFVTDTQEPGISRKIVPRHPRRCETLLKFASTSESVETACLLNCDNRCVNIVHDKPAHSIPDHFGHRCPPVRHYRSSASHRFDHRKPKRLRPVDWKQQRLCIPQELFLFSPSDFADVLDVRVLKHPLNALVVIAVCVVDLRSNLQRHSQPIGYSDGSINSLLGRNPAEKCKITSRTRMKRKQVRRQTVMNSSLPVRPGNRLALRIGDRNDWHLGVRLIKRRKVRNVEPAVQGSYRWQSHPLRVREMKVVDMKVHSVKVGCRLKLLVQHRDVMGKWVNALAVCPERGCTTRDQSCAGY